MATYSQPASQQIQANASFKEVYTVHIEHQLKREINEMLWDIVL